MIFAYDLSAAAIGRMGDAQLEEHRQECQRVMAALREAILPLHPSRSAVVIACASLLASIGNDVRREKEGL